MFRLVSLTFEGRFRGTAEQEHHLHESPASMTVPLIILAFFSIVAGFVGLPAVFGENANVLKKFLAPIFLALPAAAENAEHMLSHGTEWALMAISVAVAVTGILIARNWYVRQEGRPAERFAASFPALYALVADKFRVDELYHVLFVRPFDVLARFLWKVVDTLLIDGVLNAGAFLVELAGDFLRFLETGNVRNYALMFLLGVVGLLLFVVGAM